MTRFALIVLAGLAGIFAATEAGACRIRRPPIIPIISDYDAVALATVIRHDANSAEVRFDEVLDGRVDGEVAGLSFGAVLVQGDVVITSCGPPGPPVVTDDRVVVVLGRNGGSQYVSGWVTLDYAAQADDFFALYRRAQTPSARWRLRARWRRVNRAQGPIPLTDPERWLPPHAGGLGWGGEENFSVGFRVADDGRIAECFALQGVRDARSDAICARIRDRRFLPPMFARERDGKFRVRWNGDPPG